MVEINKQLSQSTLLEKAKDVNLEPAKAPGERVANSTPLSLDPPETSRELMAGEEPAKEPDRLIKQMELYDGEEGYRALINLYNELEKTDVNNHEKRTSLLKDILAKEYSAARRLRNGVKQTDKYLNSLRMEESEKITRRLSKLISSNISEANNLDEVVIYYVHAENSKSSTEGVVEDRRSIWLKELEQKTADSKWEGKDLSLLFIDDFKPVSHELPKTSSEIPQVPLSQSNEDLDDIDLEPVFKDYETDIASQEDQKVALYGSKERYEKRMNLYQNLLTNSQFAKRNKKELIHIEYQALKNLLIPDLIDLPKLNKHFLLEQLAKEVVARNTTQLQFNQMAQAADKKDLADSYRRNIAEHNKNTKQLLKQLNSAVIEIDSLLIEEIPAKELKFTPERQPIPYTKTLKDYINYELNSLSDEVRSALSPEIRTELENLMEEIAQERANWQKEIPLETQSYKLSRKGLNNILNTWIAGLAVKACEDLPLPFRDKIPDKVANIDEWLEENISDFFGKANQYGTNKLTHFDEMAIDELFDDTFEESAEELLVDQIKNSGEIQKRT